MPPPTSPQNERDAAILEHLRRYHLTTPEILHRLFFPEANLNAVRKVTSRLVSERRILRARLFEQRIYFVLTPREAERLGEHRSVGRKFEYQGLVNALALVAFCTANSFRKFTPREFAERYPKLVIPGVRSGNYYAKPDATKERLGSSTSITEPAPGRSSRRSGKSSREPSPRAAFGQFIMEGKFVVAVLTPTEAKAAEVKTALANEPPSGVRFRVEAVPELGELLTHRGRLREARLGEKSRPKETRDPSSPLMHPGPPPATPPMQAAPTPEEAKP